MGEWEWDFDYGDYDADHWGTPHDQRVTLNGETFYDEDAELLAEQDSVDA